MYCTLQVPATTTKLWVDNIPYSAVNCNPRTPIFHSLAGLHGTPPSAREHVLNTTARNNTAVAIHIRARVGATSKAVPTLAVATAISPDCFSTQWQYPTCAVFVDSAPTPVSGHAHRSQRHRMDPLRWRSPKRTRNPPISPHVVRLGFSTIWHGLRSIPWG